MRVSEFPETNCVKQKISDETKLSSFYLSCLARHARTTNLVPVSFSWLMTFPLLLQQLSVVCTLWFFDLNSTRRFFSRCIVIFRYWYFYWSPSSTVSVCLVLFLSRSLVFAELYSVYTNRMWWYVYECCCFSKGKKKLKSKYFSIVRTYLISIVIVIN